MVWVLVDARGRHFVYREWPCEGTYVPGEGEVGAWAEPHGKLHDGKAGPGQMSFGWGLNQYIEEITRLETVRAAGEDEEAVMEEIIQRWMDSRFGQTPTLHNDQTNTILDSLNELGFYISPAPYDHIDEGVSLINDLLSWDKRKKIDETNEPHLYISSDCKATIFALKEWTGEDGKTGACKDPVDCLRYMAMARLVDVEGIEWVTEPRSY